MVLYKIVYRDIKIIMDLSMHTHVSLIRIASYGVLPNDFLRLTAFM